MWLFAWGVGNFAEELQVSSNSALKYFLIEPWRSIPPTSEMFYFNETGTVGESVIYEYSYSAIGDVPSSVVRPDTTSPAGDIRVNECLTLSQTRRQNQVPSQSQIPPTLLQTKQEAATVANCVVL
jgi:hypothetical protein